MPWKSAWRVFPGAALGPLQPFTAILRPPYDSTDDMAPKRKRAAQASAEDSVDAQSASHDAQGEHPEDDTPAQAASTLR